MAHEDADQEVPITRCEESAGEKGAGADRAAPRRRAPARIRGAGPRVRPHCRQGAEAQRRSSRQRHDGGGERPTELVAEASQNTLAINPLIGLSPRDVAEAATSLLKVMGKAPGKTVDPLRPLPEGAGQVVKGKSELAPEPKDRRFADPAWKSNCVVQAPDAVATWHAEGADERHRRPPSSTTVDKGRRSSSPRSSPTRWRRATGCSATRRRCARSSTPAATTSSRD